MINDGWLLQNLQIREKYNHKGNIRKTSVNKKIRAGFFLRMIFVYLYNIQQHLFGLNSMSGKNFPPKKTNFTSNFIRSSWIMG